MISGLYKDDYKSLSVRSPLNTTGNQSVCTFRMIYPPLTFPSLPIEITIFFLHYSSFWISVLTISIYWTPSNLLTKCKQGNKLLVSICWCDLSAHYPVDAGVGCQHVCSASFFMWQIACYHMFSTVQFCSSSDELPSVSIDPYLHKPSSNKLKCGNKK